MPCTIYAAAVIALIVMTFGSSSLAQDITRGPSCWRISFERLRRQALPFGEAGGWLTDDEVFAAIS